MATATTGTLTAATETDKQVQLNELNVKSGSSSLRRSRRRDAYVEKQNSRIQVQTANKSNNKQKAQRKYIFA